MRQIKTRQDKRTDEEESKRALVCNERGEEEEGTFNKTPIGQKMTRRRKRGAARKAPKKGITGIVSVQI